MATALDPRISSELTDAVRELESRSCAEVVVEVRSRSGSYAHADARFASLAAFVALLVLLLSPWPFRAGWVAFDVALVWLVGLLSARKSDGVRRLVTSARERGTAVRLVAASVFHERDVDNTEHETGVLVYVSLLERRLELIADRGVLEAVPTLEWNQVLAAAHQRDATAKTAVEVIRSLVPLLERCLPAREGDRDELANAPRFTGQ